MSKPDTAADLSACVQALQDIIANPADALAIAEKALASVVMARMGVAAAAPGRVSVRIPSQIDNVDLAWAKWVLRCDPKAAGGYKFDGPFLKLGWTTALPPGAVVMLATKAGVKRQVNHAIAQIVQDDGRLDGWSGPPVHRFNWDDLVERIERYHAHVKDAPLFTARALPGPKPPPPIPPPSSAHAVADPASQQALVAAAHAVLALAVQPDPPEAESLPAADGAGSFPTTR